MKRLMHLIWFASTVYISPLQAADDTYREQHTSQWWTSLAEDITQTWQEPQRYDLYLPFLSWHARFMYDKEKTDKYNEMPWGEGWGCLALTKWATGVLCLPWYSKTHITNGSLL